MGKASRFAFSEAKLRALPTPAAGRAWHYDTKARGLAVCKTAAGGCSFYFYKWLDGRPARLILGKFPSLSVEQARKAAETAVGEIAAGRDPEEERRAKRQQPILGELFEHWMLYARAHKRHSVVWAEFLRIQRRTIPHNPRLTQHECSVHAGLMGGRGSMGCPWAVPFGRAEIHLTCTCRR